MLAALDQLPEEQKSLLLLVGVEDFSYDEAARILGVPIGTVMSRLSRARQRLRSIVETGTVDAAAESEMTGEDVPIGEDELQALSTTAWTAPRRAAVEAYLAQPSRAARARSRPSVRQRASLRGQLEGKVAEPIPPRLRIANIQAARRAALVRRLSGDRRGRAIFVVGAGTGWFASAMRPEQPSGGAGADRRRRPGRRRGLSHLRGRGRPSGRGRRRAGGAPAAVAVAAARPASSPRPTSRRSATA